MPGSSKRAKRRLWLAAVAVFTIGGALFWFGASQARQQCLASRERYWDLAFAPSSTAADLNQVVDQATECFDEPERATFSLGAWVINRLYRNPELEASDSVWIEAMRSAGADPELGRIANALLARTEVRSLGASVTRRPNERAAISLWRDEVNALYSEDRVLPGTEGFFPDRDAIAATPRSGPARIERLVRQGRINAALELATRLEHGPWTQLLYNMRARGDERSTPLQNDGASRIERLFSILISATYEYPRDRNMAVWSRVWPAIGEDPRLCALALSVMLAVGYVDVEPNRLRMLTSERWALWLLMSQSIRNWDGPRLFELARPHLELHVAQQAVVLGLSALGSEPLAEEILGLLDPQYRQQALSFRARHESPSWLQVSAEQADVELPSWLLPTTADGWRTARWRPDALPSVLTQMYEEGEDLQELQSWTVARLGGLREALTAEIFFVLASAELRLRGALPLSLVAWSSRLTLTGAANDELRWLMLLREQDARSVRRVFERIASPNTDQATYCRALGDLGVWLGVSAANRTPFVPATERATACRPQAGLLSWVRSIEAAVSILEGESRSAYVAAQRAVYDSLLEERTGCAAAESGRCRLFRRAQLALANARQS